MSQDALNDFMTNLSIDETLRSALQERFGQNAVAIPARDVMDFAAQHGYELTADDIQVELSDDALGSVSGGTQSPEEGKDSPEEVPIETIKLNYTTIEFEYAPYGGKP